MRKHYFAASGERYRVRVKVVPHLETNPRKCEEPRISDLEYDISIMDMSPSLTSGHIWEVKRQVKYSAPNYLNPKKLSTKRCQSYFFRNNTPETVLDWKRYSDFIADELLHEGLQLKLFHEEEKKERLPTRISDKDVESLVRQKILRPILVLEPAA